MKIIPYFTKIYSLTLFIAPKNRFCVEYCSRSIFHPRDTEDGNPKYRKAFSFDDINDANLFLATQIYPNIVWGAIIENFSCDSYWANDVCLPKNNIKPGMEYYFVDTKNFRCRYVCANLSISEEERRNEIIAKYKENVGINKILSKYKCAKIK